MFLSDEGPTLQTLKFAFHIGSTPTFLYFDLKFVVLLTYTEAPLRAGLSTEFPSGGVSLCSRRRNAAHRATILTHFKLYSSKTFLKVQ